jgi:Zn-dependent protease with chaperone function
MEADRYSLETVDLPDALASALVKTAEYRNPRPGRLEEILFYDHPSVQRRVLTAMEWKATHGRWSIFMSGDLREPKTDAGLSESSN